MHKLILTLPVLLALGCLSTAQSVSGDAITIKVPIAKEFPDVESLIVQSSPRITGGEVVRETDIPYAAGVIMQGVVGSRWCGGVLVSTSFVLTTASCLMRDPVSVTALLGASNMSSVNDLVMVDQMTFHSEYDAESWQNDIALLRLERPTTVGATIRPVRLPNIRQLQSPFTGQLATVSGWGALFQNAPEILPLNDLRRVNLPVISNVNCAIRFPGWITENQICVATELGSPCHGDQGGPLTVADPDGGTTLIGIFAYNSILGCNSQWPAVFTRITPYLFWIAEHANVTISEDFEY